MPKGLRLGLTIAALLPLAGCAGFPTFVLNTFDPFHTPHKVKGDAENLKLAYGEQVPGAGLTPEAGQPWPTSYPMDPTLMDVSKQDKGIR